MDTPIQVTLLFLWTGSLIWPKPPPANIWLAGFRSALLPVFYTNCTPPVASKNKDANQWTENWHWISSQRKPKTLRLGSVGEWSRLCPCSSSTVSDICSALHYYKLWGTDQSKQLQHGQETTTETKEQMILFQPQPDVYLQLITDFPPTHLAHHAAYLLFFFTLLTSTPPSLPITFSHPLNVTETDKPSGGHHRQMWKSILNECCADLCWPPHPLGVRHVQG